MNFKIAKLTYLCMLFCRLVTVPVIGQEKDHDAGLWLNVSVTPKLAANKWAMTYSVEYRNKNNFTQTSLWSSTANFYYELNPYLSVGAGGEVFLNKEPDGTYYPEYRYYPAVLIPFGSGIFSGSVRTYLMNTFTQWRHPDWEIRNRFKMSFMLKGSGLKPFLATEPYYELGKVDDYRFKKIRYFAGLSCGFGRHYHLDVYYLREDYLHSASVNNIIAVDCNFSF